MVKGRKRRLPHGGRGLKFSIGTINFLRICRLPHGGRGLKFNGSNARISLNPSPSSRRAWIEMPSTVAALWSPVSPSSRRAWIEIFFNIVETKCMNVAFLTEGVD